jgi:hypothetical protein
MDELKFELEWDRVDGSLGDELAATWARLSVLVDETAISEVYDHRSLGVRRHLFIPLYPLAEWLASHWWTLLYKPEVPGREGYDFRHNLRFGPEGFAFPELIIKPAGERALIEWRAFDLPEAQVSFSSSGSRTLDLADIRQSLADLIDTVLARLDQRGVRDTFLHREWQDIRVADEEETAFCIAAARLGQDPYGLDDTIAHAILAVPDKMPGQWQDDFFAVADSRDLAAQAQMVAKARELARSTSDRFTAIAELRKRTEKIDSKRAPWEQGYAVAKKLRDQLGLDAIPLNTDSIIADAFSIVNLDGITLTDAAARNLFDAMVDSDDGENPGFLTTKQRPEQMRFAFCRALFEYLTAADAASAPVTVARTDRQKRNRAFATEFLAPADWIRARISGTWVGPDEVDEWADALGVSTAVVEHQLENHRLAEFVGY